MPRYTVISTDCHAGPSYADGSFYQYVDPDYREQCRVHSERAIEEFQARLARLFAPEFTAIQDGTQAAQQGGREGAFDITRRLGELEADGVVAEVIFPDGSQRNPAPFFAANGPGAKDADHRLQAVGAWAYNRWLADFCGAHPGRHAGIALVTIHDVSEAVRQLEWAREHGLRGALLPAGVGDLPFYNHPRYEPLWSAASDLAMPLHTHVGSATPDYQDLPGDGALFAYESLFFSHRPLQFLILGGVFERHPRLRVVFAEQGCEWVPEALAMLDRIVAGMFRHERGRLSLMPSEYWKRQCFVQAMFLARSEVEAREAIGVANMLWGSDYPHYEGSWPHSARAISETLAGLPDAHVRAILSHNAARVYGFDLTRLDPIGAYIGPEVDST